MADLTLSKTFLNRLILFDRNKHTRRLSTASIATQPKWVEVKLRSRGRIGAETDCGARTIAMAVAHSKKQLIRFIILFKTSKVRGIYNSYARLLAVVFAVVLFCFRVCLTEITLISKLVLPGSVP